MVWSNEDYKTGAIRPETADNCQGLRGKLYTRWAFSQDRMTINCMLGILSILRYRASPTRRKCSLRDAGIQEEHPSEEGTVWCFILGILLSTPGGTATSYWQTGQGTRATAPQSRTSTVDSSSCLSKVTSPLAAALADTPALSVSWL